MTQNQENLKNLKIKEVLEELLYLRQENEQLKKDNTVLCNELTYFKERCVDLEEEVNDLTSENIHFKAKNLAMSKRLNYLTSAEAGRDFARSLLGKPMTRSDIAEEEFIANGEAHYAKFCGDDY